MNVKEGKNAYTLIELLIVAVIILLFSGLFLAQYNSSNEQIKLKTETQKLVNMLELARKKTIARNTIASCIGNFNGYNVALSSDRYVLSYCCADNCTTISTLQTTLFPPSSITITSIAKTDGTPLSIPYNIQFIPGFQGTELTSDITVNLKNTAIPSTNKCIQLSISKIGIVTLKDAFILCP